MLLNVNIGEYYGVSERIKPVFWHWNLFDASLERQQYQRSEVIKKEPKLLFSNLK